MMMMRVEMMSMMKMIDYGEEDTEEEEKKTRKKLSHQKPK